jgi:hypothetical protein
MEIEITPDFSERVYSPKILELVRLAEKVDAEKLTDNVSFQSLFSEVIEIERAIGITEEDETHEQHSQRLLCFVLSQVANDENASATNTQAHAYKKASTSS